jgi:hypothetical protein
MALQIIINFFKTDNPELDIPYDTYTSIISQFNKEVIDLIINNNIGIFYSLFRFY